MPKYPREKGKPVELPLYGDAEHNLGIYHAIGVLAINWGSDESVFLAMLQALLGGEKQTAIIVWLSFHNTANRLELLRRLTKQHVTDKALRADIESAVVEFAGCTKTRNFFCHAAYVSDRRRAFCETFVRASRSFGQQRSEWNAKERRSDVTLML